MPISKKTGKRYAAGSSKSYGGWEDRHCYHCGRTLTLKDAAMSSMLANGAAFTLCADHIGHYSEAYADFEPAEADHADDLHPDQLAIE